MNYRARVTPRPLFWSNSLEDQAIKTLFLPFEIGELPIPDKDDRWLFLNAAVPEHDDFDLRPSLTCVQGFRPPHLSLLKAGYAVLSEIDAGANYSGALVLLGKHRQENRRNIQLALSRIMEDAPVLVAGAKTAGVESMRREVTAFLSVGASWSKHHAQVFMIKRPAHWVPPTNDLVIPIKVNGLSLHTAAGMFSHKAVDAGSEFLAQHLVKLEGNVADFGAGWGFLSLAALRCSPEIRSIHLHEADYASLQSAERNLGPISPTIPKTLNWSDLTQEIPSQKFDVVIMNPPFHAGRRTEPDIGKRFIEVAGASLKPGGQLLMVANKQLAYEDTLQKAFRRFERIDENRLYKVIRAVR